MAMNDALPGFLHERSNNLEPRFMENLNPLPRVSFIWVQHCHHDLTHSGINQCLRT
jgi:hypothetical protein